MKDENITRQLDKLKVFFLKYYPIRIKNVGLEEKVARQIVWDFKDGNHYEAVAQMTAKRLVEHFGEQVRSIVFSCVPALPKSMNTATRTFQAEYVNCRER